MRLGLLGQKLCWIRDIFQPTPQYYFSTSLKNIQSDATSSSAVEQLPSTKRKRRIISPVAQKPLEEKVELLKPYFGATPTIGESFPLQKEQLVQLLELQDHTTEQVLFDYANSITESVYNKRVFFRGIIEFSNVCEKDCYYCGIRKHMKQLHRYTMSKDEIVEQALWAHKNQFGSIMLQSGEVTTQKRIDFLCEVIREIKQKTKDENSEGLGVSISLGELTKEQYAQLLEAGAHRYLLRIESSNPELYKKLHPENHSWQTRDQCLKDLRELGYQVGTGVMIQLPYQTTEDLANDILYFKERKVDMIGMGPYIVQDETPLGKIWRETHNDPNFDMKEYNKQLFRTSLKMIALSRIVCKSPNIAATTALQAINPAGREIALMSGANMVMPIITPTKYRVDYQLYQGKPCIDDTADECRDCLTKRVRWAGKDLQKSSWGDPLSAKGRAKWYKE